jgi:hypothetical protein
VVRKIFMMKVCEPIKNLNFIIPPASQAVLWVGWYPPFSSPLKPGNGFLMSEIMVLIVYCNLFIQDLK